MSTRCSIIYGHGLHLYREANSNDVCVTWDDADASESEINPQYGDPIIPFPLLEEWHRDLGEFIQAFKAELSPTPSESGGTNET